MVIRLKVLHVQNVAPIADGQNLATSEVSLGRALIPRPSAYKALAFGVYLYQAELPRLALTQITQNKRLTVTSDNLHLRIYNVALQAFKLMTDRDCRMPEYLVNVVIQNKSYISDPEGETILKDLIAKGGYTSVRSVRTAKMLSIVTEAKDSEEAESMIRKLCDDLRIYNPVVSSCNVEVVGMVQAKN